MSKNPKDDDIEWIKRLVIGICLRRGIERNLADDFAQDISAKFLILRERDKVPAKQRSYIVRCAKNACINEYRVKKRRKTQTRAFDTEFSHPVTGKNVLLDRIFRNEEVGIVRDAINRLQPAQKELIELRFNQEMIQEEIAEKLGVSTATVNTRLQKAYDTLRRLMPPKLRDENDAK